MNNTEQVLNSEKALEMAHSISRTMHTIQLQTDLINHIPSAHDIDESEALARYKYLNKALDNLHELNQILFTDLDKAAGYLYDIAEEQQEKEEKPSA